MLNSQLIHNKKRFRYHKTQPLNQSDQRILTQLEGMIAPNPPLTSNPNCKCELCGSHQFQTIEKQIDYFKQSEGSEMNLFLILKKLSNEQLQYYNLNINIPIFFSYKDGIFQVFQSIKNQVKSGLFFHSLQQVFGLVKQREEKKKKLKQSFYQNSSYSFNEKFIHRSYFEKVIPTSFTESTKVESLRENRKKIKSYIFHQDDKYIVQEIEQHKLKKTDPFCIFRYTDLTYVIHTYEETQLYLRKDLMKTNKVISFIESFTKVKKNTEPVFYSSYKRGLTERDTLYNFAYRQILIRKGDINQQHSNYLTSEDLEVMLERLEKNVHDLINYTTFKMIILLELFCDFKIRKILIKWILNEEDEPVLHQIPQLLIDDALQREERIKKVYSKEFKTIFTNEKIKILQKQALLKKKIIESQKSLLTEDISLGSAPSKKPKSEIRKVENKRSKSLENSGISLSINELFKMKEQRSFTLKKNPYQGKKTYLLRPFKTQSDMK